MNLLLTINLARKRFMLSSGALAHLGLGLMFLGIVSSSAYDRSEKVKLPQNEAKSALGYELELQQPLVSEHRKGITLFLPLEIKEGNSTFSAQPDIYTEQTRGGQPQRFVHPYIGRGLVSDLYISPVDFDPGQKPRPKNEIELEKDKPMTLHDYTLTFTGFDVSGMMGHQKGTREMSVGTTIEVTYGDADPVTVKPVLHIGAEQTPPERVKLPGPEDAYLTIARINAGAKTVTLRYEGPEPDAMEAEAPILPSMIAEISIKPGMTVLWLGCFLILFGGTVGIARRKRKGK
jgi:cytochrome c-type biogenesis protein CcmF